MNNIVVDAPYNPATTYIANCPATNVVAPCDNIACVTRVVVGASPTISAGGKVGSLGTGAGQLCFSTAAQYYSILVGNGLNTGGVLYTGNYLNWYFNAGNTVPAWTNQIQKPGTDLRIDIAKTAAKKLVDSLSGVRMGLSAYYNVSDGGALMEVVDDLDTIANKKTNLKSKIDALTASNNTPLGETLSDIGHYFCHRFIRAI